MNKLYGLRLFGLAGLALALAACGGSGGGSSSSGGSSGSAASGSQTVAAMYSGNLATNGSLITGGLTGAAATATSSSTNNNSINLAQWAASNTTSETPAPADTTTDCQAGGSKTTHHEDDLTTITYNDCKSGNDSFSSTESGVIKVKKLADDEHELEAVDYSRTLSTGDKQTLDGKLTLKDNDSTQTMSSEELTLTIHQVLGQQTADETLVLTDFLFEKEKGPVESVVKAKGHLVGTGAFAFDVNFDNTASNDPDQALFRIKNSSKNPYAGSLLIKDNTQPNTKTVLVAQSDELTYVLTRTINGVAQPPQTFPWP